MADSRAATANARSRRPETVERANERERPNGRPTQRFADYVLSAIINTAQHLLLDDEVGHRKLMLRRRRNPSQLLQRLCGRRWNAQLPEAFSPFCTRRKSDGDTIIR